jgi:hypothetical protein
MRIEVDVRLAPRATPVAAQRRNDVMCQMQTNASQQKIGSLELQ